MHPILFHVGSFPVRAYGLVILLATFLATQVSITLARLTVKEYEQHLVPLVYSVVIGALIGARVWQVFSLHRLTILPILVKFSRFGTVVCRYRAGLLAD